MLVPSDPKTGAGLRLSSSCPEFCPSIRPAGYWGFLLLCADGRDPFLLDGMPSFHYDSATYVKYPIAQGREAECPHVPTYCV